MNVESLPSDDELAGSSSDAAVARSHWDGDAHRYAAEHADYLTDFYWCPERVRERDVRLLEDVRGKRILELGAGTAPCSAWVAAHGGMAVAQDISGEMLRRALVTDESSHRISGTSTDANRGTDEDPTGELHLVQSDAAVLPFADSVFDATFSSFGALPFIGDLGSSLMEIRRVLKPGGRCVLASNHPMAWVFVDDPGPAGLLAQVPYFQRVYEEFGEDNPVPPTDDATLNAQARTYAEYHHTVGDWVRAHAQAGLLLEDVIEPEWQPGTPAWGQWSELRGSVFPGTAIFVSRAPE